MGDCSFCLTLFLSELLFSGLNSEAVSMLERPLFLLEKFGFCFLPLLYFLAIFSTFLSANLIFTEKKASIPVLFSSYLYSVA